MSLYAITEEMRVLSDLAHTHGAQSPEFDAALAEHVAALAEAFDAKAERYAEMIRECESRSAARDAESARLNALAITDAKLAARLRETLMQAMQATDRRVVQTEKFRLSVVNNGGKLPVVIEDESALPAEFTVPTMTVRVDRDSLRSALEAGTHVPGARLGQRGTRLDLK